MPVEKGSPIKLLFDSCYPFRACLMNVLEPMDLVRLKVALKSDCTEAEAKKYTSPVVQLFKDTSWLSSARQLRYAVVILGNDLNAPSVRSRPGYVKDDKYLRTATVRIVIVIFGPTRAADPDTVLSTIITSLRTGTDSARESRTNGNIDLSLSLSCSDVAIHTTMSVCHRHFVTPSRNLITYQDVVLYAKRQRRTASTTMQTARLSNYKTFVCSLGVYGLPNIRSCDVISYTNLDEDDRQEFEIYDVFDCSAWK